MLQTYRLRVFLILISIGLVAGASADQATKEQPECSSEVCVQRGVSIVPVPQGVERAEVHLNLRSGRVVLTGGSPDLLEAKFNQENESPPPVIHVKRNGEKGQVEIEGGAMFSQWNVALNPAILTNLQVSTKAADAELSSQNSDFGNIAVVSGGGETIVNLTGHHPYLDQITIKQLNGEVVMTLLGDFPLLTKIGLQTTVGNITLVMSGAYPSINTIDLITTLGNIDLALGRSTLGENLKVNILSTSGDSQLNLPYNSSVNVTFTTVDGHISAPGLTLTGEHHPRPNQYTFMVTGESQTTIDVDTKTTSGNMNVNYSK